MFLLQMIYSILYSRYIVFVLIQCKKNNCFDLPTFCSHFEAILRKTWIFKKDAGRQSFYSFEKRKISFESHAPTYCPSYKHIDSLASETLYCVKKKTTVCKTMLTKIFIIKASPVSCRLKADRNSVFLFQ